MENKNYDSFLKLDLSEYTGEWIAIQEGKIVARGKSSKEVYEKAEEISKKRPLIVKVPEKKTMIF